MIITLESFLGDEIWIFGIGIILALSLVLTILIKGDLLEFLGFTVIGIGIMVYGGILETWAFVVIIIIFLSYLVFRYKKNKEAPDAYN